MPLSNLTTHPFLPHPLYQALWNEGLLPRVISGASAGSLMAALIGTRNEEELSLILCDGDECRQGILSPRRDFFKQKTEVRAPSPPHTHHSPSLLSLLSLSLSAHPRRSLPLPLSLLAGQLSGGAAAAAAASPVAAAAGRPAAGLTLRRQGASTSCVCWVSSPYLGL